MRRWGDADPRGQRFGYAGRINSGDRLSSRVATVTKLCCMLEFANRAGRKCSHTHTHTHTKAKHMSDGQLINSVWEILSQCVCISHHHIVHFKYLIILFVNYISEKLGSKGLCRKNKEQYGTEIIQGPPNQKY